MRTHCLLFKQIPLILGPLRDINNKAIAVDAVFNEKVIDCCVDPPESKNTGRETLSGNKAMALFKQQIVELACDWITRDTGVTFSKSWVDCSVRYSGNSINLSTSLIPCLLYFHYSPARSSLV